MAESAPALRKRATPEQLSARRRDNFMRVCGPRVNRAIKGIKLVKHCARKTDYEFEAGHVDAIEHALLEAVRETVAAFRGDDPKQEPFEFAPHQGPPKRTFDA